MVRPSAGKLAKPPPDFRLTLFLRKNKCYFKIWYLKIFKLVRYKQNALVHPS